MSLNDTVSAERVHIGFFGRRNAGKSSLVNAVTGQALSVVSDVRGTTTDPVQKSMELLPVGPVVILDTPGLDDEGELGLSIVRNLRLLVHMLADAVTDEGAHHGEPVGLDVGLYGVSDVRNSITLACEFHALEKALPRDIYELLRLVRNLTAGIGCGAVAVEAVP